MLSSHTKQLFISNQEWIAKVASKGGTTEIALQVFEKGMLQEVIVNAVKAANNRAIELGK